jgi:hypothetical protein
MAAVVGFGASAHAQITGTDHDFSGYAWSGNEICKPCHTPHAGHPERGALWNHDIPSASQAYILFGGSAGTSADIDSISKLCLGCHDGTVAVDSFGGATGTTFIGSLGDGTSLIGTDLSNDHPIGKMAVYPTTTSTSFNPQNASHQVAYTWGTLRLRPWVDPTGTTQYAVGCKTCHNPHSSSETVGGVTTRIPHMLYINNTGSHLCLTCHIK